MRKLLVGLMAGSLLLYVVASGLPAAAQPLFEASDLPPTMLTMPTTATMPTMPTMPTMGNAAELEVSALKPKAATSSSAYAFSTNTSASLFSMGTSATQALGPNLDEQASAVIDIGFDFFFQGAAYRQFTVSSNGLMRLGPAAVGLGFPYMALGTPGQALIAPYASDQSTHAGDGKVQYRLLGAFPDRILIVEWLNMQSCFAGGGADMRYQVRLFETTGAIELAYGSMTMSATGTGTANCSNVHIGFSSGNTAGTIASVSAPQSGTPAPSANLAAASAQTNAYNVAGPIDSLTSSFEGQRRVFSFVPPVPAAPAGISFAGVTATTTTVQWTDSSNELLYAIYRSADGVNFVLDGTTLQNATSYAATNLVPSTSYTWRVHAVSEGALSAALTGTQATTAPAITRVSATGGNWSSPATWVGNAIPAAGDAVVIAAGHIVTIDTSPTVYSITVNGSGQLQFESVNPRTLTTNGPLTINAGGGLTTLFGGRTTGHRVAVNGNFTNNGNVNLSPLSVSSADLVFNGPFNSTMTLGAGSVTNLRRNNGLIVAKSGGQGPVVNFVPGGSFTADSSPSEGFLLITGGTLQLSGSATFSGKLFASAAWSLPAAGGFWLTNPNATIAAQPGTVTISGFLTVSGGTLNAGTASDDSMVLAPGAGMLMSVGAVNVAGRLGVASASDAVSFGLFGGTITVARVGNTSATLASFDFGTADASVASMNGGTVVVQLPATNGAGPGDYRNLSPNSDANAVAGTVQFGNAASGAAKSFRAQGAMPDVVVSSASGGHTLSLLPHAGIANSARSVTINPGTKLDIGAGPFLVRGAALTNNGTLAATAGTLVFERPNAAQTYGGNGIAIPAVATLQVRNGANLTFDPATTNNVPVLAFQLTSGTVTNAGKITLGNGGATTGIITIGDAAPTVVGGFDEAPSFNLGSGGQIVNYLRTTASRTTGPEIYPNRSLAKLVYDDPAHALTVAGGSLVLTGASAPLVLANGRIIVPAPDYLYVTASGGAVSRANGWVDGTLKKSFVAAGNKTFEVGSANGYSPVAVNVTAAPSFPTDFAVTAFEDAIPNFGSPTLALQRYWYLAPSNVTADLTFNWLDPVDLPPAAPESALILYNQNGAMYTPGGTVSAAANTATITGVTSFAAWTLGVPVGLSLAKSHVGDAFRRSQAGAQYVLSVTNGPTALPNGTVITVKDTLPAGLSFVGATAAGGWTCGAVAQDVTCMVTQVAGFPFAANASSTITLMVNVAANAPETLENTATCNCNLVSKELNTRTDTVSVEPIVGSGISLTVSRSGSGTGKVTDANLTIVCGAFCANSYPAGTVVTLTAAPDPGSVFTGWLGACTGTGACTVTMNAATTVSATFAPAAIGNRILDIDMNNAYDALSDGLLVLRGLFNLAGTALTSNAVGASAMRTDPAAISAYLNDVRPLLDVDGNGITDALTDGLMIIRHLFGLIGDSVTANAIGPNATRTTAAAVQGYINTLKP